jgi:hypothetical protein
MTTKQELYKKRDNLWNDAKDFIHFSKFPDGTITPEAAAEFDKRADEIIQLGENIKRYEQMEALGRELGIE